MKSLKSVEQEKENLIDNLLIEEEKGDAASQFKLAVMYYRGREVTENKAKAIEIFKKLAEQGFAKAQYNLGYMYYKGEGESEDKEKAIGWLKKSAEQGHEMAQKYLSSISNSGKAELKKDSFSGINYIDEYYKYWIYEDGEKFINPEFSNECGGYILEVKNGKTSGINYYEKKLVEIFRQMDINDSWITIVPSSKKDVLNEGMCELINRVVSQLKDVKFYQCLNRKYTIEKLATGGNRSIKNHSNSIELCGERETYYGAKIYLIDDIMTTGNSLLACKKILEEAGANVVCIALGKTADIDDMSNEEENDVIYMYNLDKEIQKILDIKENDALNDYVKHILEKYKKCKDKFNKYKKLISNNKELKNRIREVYLYLIEQLTKISTIDGFYFDIGNTSHKKLYLLKVILYRELVYDNDDTFYVSDYLKTIRNFQNKYGTGEDIADIKKEFEITDFYLNEYTTQSFKGFKKIDKIDSTSSVYNDISKGLYESNTDMSLRGALESINKAIELSPDERQLYLNKVLILIKSNEFKSIFDNINQAVNLKNDSQEIVKFDKCNDIILLWLKKINELMNSAESNYLTGMFIYEFCLKRPSYIDWMLKFKNENLSDKEKEVKEYIRVANEKSNGGYKELTDGEIINKSRENECHDKNMYKNEPVSYIYRYNKTEIDKMKQEQIKLENCDDFCDFDVPTGPEWLGGVETEEEFWEH